MKRDKILHFLTNNKTFLPRLIREYESVFPGRNLFFIRKGAQEVETKNVQPDHVFFYDPREEKDRDEIRRRAEECLFAIFHTYDFRMVDVFEIVSGHIPIVWCGFGYDFMLFTNALTTKTWLSLFRYSPIYGIKQRLLKSPVGKIKYRRFVKTVDQIHYFGCILPGEYKKIKTGRDPEVKEFCYRAGHREETEQQRTTGDNVILAHSRALECNHLDGIDLFKRYGRADQKGIMFLNYGFLYKGFLDHTIEYGKKTLGDRFQYYTDFLSLEDYEEIVRSCSFAILPFLRQIGLGCLNTLFLNGAKVFLYQNSFLYNFYTANGFVVYSIEKDLASDSRFDKLSDADRQTNREKCLEFWGKAKISGAIREMYDYFSHARND